MLNSDTMKFKLKIANLLCENKDIITALDIKDNREVMYNYIFPYVYFPTQEETQALIGFELNTPRIDNNEYFKYSELFFRVACHRSAMKTIWGGTRVDVLDGIVTQKLNWNIELGLEMKLKSSRGVIITDTYYGKEIIFENLRFNSLNNGIKNGLFE